MHSLNSALSILQAHGFDVSYDESIDAVLPVVEEEMDSDSLPARQRRVDQAIFIRRQAQRCMLHRALVYQYTGIYPEATKCYKMYIHLASQRKNDSKDKSQRVARDTLVDYAKVLLAQGQFELAQEIFNKIIREHVMPLRSQSKHNTDVEESGEEALWTPIQVLPLDEEVAILAKYAQRQVQELLKANVFSSVQRRLYDVQDSGYLAMRTSTGPVEYVAGRSTEYWAQLSMLVVKNHKLKQEMTIISSRKEVTQKGEELQRQAKEMLRKVKSILPAR
jgi:tetratricopeptide (TPR) repeat protein